MTLSGDFLLLVVKPYTMNDRAHAIGADRGGHACRHSFVIAQRHLARTSHAYARPVAVAERHLRHRIAAERRERQISQRLRLTRLRHAQARRIHEAHEELRAGAARVRGQVLEGLTGGSQIGRQEVAEQRGDGHLLSGSCVASRGRTAQVVERRAVVFGVFAARRRVQLRHAHVVVILHLRVVGLLWLLLGRRLGRGLSLARVHRHVRRGQLG